jgi:hypothetical protein
MHNHSLTAELAQARQTDVVAASEAARRRRDAVGRTRPAGGFMATLRDIGRRRAPASRSAAGQEC